jgi:2-oxo-hept-3-ene-1,7-dioate hydratase
LERSGGFSVSGAEWDSGIPDFADAAFDVGLPVNPRHQSQGHPPMLSAADRSKAADILMDAEKARKQAVQLSKTWPDITIEDAYAISTEVANRKIKAGARLIGHKVGLTSKAMQRSSQIDEPDYGHLLDYMMVADGAKVPHENYCRPRVEIELAFILGKPLKGPGVGLTDVLRATEYVVPAIEIVDARLQDPRKIFDTVADNGAAAGIAVGGRPVGPMDIDLRWVGGIMYVNSEIEETGVAAGVLGHPALGVAWLANKLGAHGVTLEPGHLVLAGSFTRVVFAKKGDTLHADFGALGGIAVQFV